MTASPRRRTRARRGRLGVAALVGVAVPAVALTALRLPAGTASAAVDEPAAPGATASSAAPRAVPAASPPGAHAGDAMPSPVPTALDPDRPAAAPDWTSVLGSVDEGRRRAIAAGSLPELTRYVDPAGSAWASDAALVGRIASAGARLEGGSLVVLAVRPAQVAPDRVRLSVQDRRDPYAVVVDGVRTPSTARGPRWWSVTLTRSESGSWRIAEVSETGATVSTRPAPR